MLQNDHFAAFIVLSQASFCPISRRIPLNVGAGFGPSLRSGQLPAALSPARLRRVLPAAKTKYKEAIEAEVFGGARTYALLHKKKDKWTVVTFRIGQTDVCWVGWDKPPFGAPRKVLPSLGKP